MPRLIACRDYVREEILLALPVPVKVAMIIQVVLGKISEKPNVELAAVDPSKVKGMGRDLHDNMGNPGIEHFSKHLLDVVGFWSCDGGWKDAVPIPIVDRADHPTG